MSIFDCFWQGGREGNQQISFLLKMTFCKALSEKEKNVSNLILTGKRTKLPIYEPDNNFLPSNLTLPFQKS